MLPRQSISLNKPIFANGSQYGIDQLSFCPALNTTVVLFALFALLSFAPLIIPAPAGDVVVGGSGSQTPAFSFLKTAAKSPREHF